MSADSSTVEQLTAQIVSAFAARNRVEHVALPALVAAVRGAFSSLASGEAAPAARPEPAVPIARSITSDYLVCLEDGARLKMLERHLRTHYDLSPQQYRERWGLPPDYPMVAPGYALRRSTIARALGLGRVAGGERAA